MKDVNKMLEIQGKIDQLESFEAGNELDSWPTSKINKQLNLLNDIIAMHPVYPDILGHIEDYKSRKANLSSQLFRRLLKPEGGGGGGGAGTGAGTGGGIRKSKKKRRKSKKRKFKNRKSKRRRRSTKRK